MQIPVTLISGFLGAGKTTLVQRVLSDRMGERCAVVVNEFGAVGIDGDLLEAQRVARGGEGIAVVELPGGCICCEIQDDLRTTLLALLRDRPTRGGFDRILVEASGAASPGPAVQTFLVDGVLQSQLRLDGVVTLVHAALVDEQLSSLVEASAQIAYADRVILNHADQLDEDALDAAAARLAELNPLAEVRCAERADVSLDWVFGGLGNREAGGEAPWQQPKMAEGGASHAAHTSGLSSVSLTAQRPVDRDALLIWLEFLAKRRTHELMRIKGVCVVKGPGGPSALLVQGVYRWLETSDYPGDPGGTSSLVLIGRHLSEEELRRGWDAIAR